MRKKPTAYENKVNQFIPTAELMADTVTLDEYPELGPRIIGGSRHKGAVKLSEMKLNEREIYQEVIDFWNHEYHAAMNALCQQSGVRNLVVGV